MRSGKKAHVVPFGDLRAAYHRPEHEGPGGFLGVEGYFPGQAIPTGCGRDFERQSGQR